MMAPQTHVKSKRFLWLCPTMCGCAITLRQDTTFVDETEAALYLLQNQHLPDPEFEELQASLELEIFNPVPEKIENQCSEHTQTDPVALFSFLNGKYGGMIHQPDTCECTISYYYDKTQANLDHIGIHNILASKKCPIHAAVERGANHVAIIVEENTRKNLAMAEFVNIVGKEPEWSFNSERELEIDVKSFSPEEKELVKDLEKIKPKR